MSMCMYHHRGRLLHVKHCWDQDRKCPKCPAALRRVFWYNGHCISTPSPRPCSAAGRPACSRLGVAWPVIFPAAILRVSDTIHIFHPNVTTRRESRPSDLAPSSSLGGLGSTGITHARLTSNGVLDAFHARYALRKQESSPNADGVRAEAQRLDYVRPSRDTAIHVDLERPASLLASRRRSRQARRFIEQRLRDARRPAILRTQEVRSVFADLQQDIEGGTGGVELSAAVI